MRTVQTTYRYRIEPTAAQQVQLVSFAGARRWVWNWALARKQAHYQATNERLTYNALAAELTVLKQQPETAWLKEIDSQLLQQALRDLDTAFKNFFARRARYPRFKSRKRDALRFRIPQRVTVTERGINVPKIGRIVARIHRPLVGTTKSATFKQAPDGHWYVCFVVEQHVPARTERAITSHVGIDVGLKDFAVLSTGKRIPNPRYFRTQEKKLRRAQRALSRKAHGSRNRAKARTQVARIHQNIRNQRNDFLHKLSRQWVDSYDLISIEDLNTHGLARTKLAKSVLDAGWSSLRQMLTYKVDWYDKHLMTIGRFYPSSRLHRLCGAINHELTLSDRLWVCACGATLDRDLNAAQNIDAEGLRLFEQTVAAGQTETLNACGQSVRPPMAAGLDEPRSLPL
jgi:putative transposase